VKVLIGCVGDREPQWRDQNGTLRIGALTTLIARTEPGAVVLFYTDAHSPRAGTKSHADALVARLLSERPGLPILTRMLPGNVQDFDKQYDALREYWPGVRQELHERVGSDLKLHLALTGARGITDAWLTLIMAGQVTVQQVIQLNEAGQISTVPLLRRREQAAMARAEELLQLHHYRLAADLLEREVWPTADHERRTRIRWVVDLCHLFAHWDQYRFQEALEQLQQRIPDGSAWASWRDQAVVTLGQLLANNPQSHTLELYWNMRRRFQQELYVDALTRFRRLYEGLLTRATQRQGIPFKKKHPSLYDMRQAYVQQNPLSLLGTNVRINLPDGPETLPLGKAVDKLIEYRHQSIAAHGASAVPPVVVERVFALVPLLVEDLLPLPQSQFSGWRLSHPLANHLPELLRLLKES
jgi:hypothetical protein